MLDRCVHVQQLHSKIGAVFIGASTRAAYLVKHGGVFAGVLTATQVNVVSWTAKQQLEISDQGRWARTGAAQ
jgi:hypothetical protein